MVRERLNLHLNLQVFYMRLIAQSLFGITMVILLSAGSCKTKEQMAEDLTVKSQKIVEKWKAQSASMPTAMEALLATTDIPQAAGLQPIVAELAKVSNNELASLFNRMKESCSETELDGFSIQMDGLSDIVNLGLKAKQEAWAEVEASGLKDPLFEVANDIMALAEREGITPKLKSAFAQMLVAQNPAQLKAIQESLNNLISEAKMEELKGEAMGMVQKRLGTKGVLELLALKDKLQALLEKYAPQFEAINQNVLDRLGAEPSPVSEQCLRSLSSPTLLSSFQQAFARLGFTPGSAGSLQALPSSDANLAARSHRGPATNRHPGAGMPDMDEFQRMLEEQMGQAQRPARL
jgi:hypothetical protein